MEQKPPAKPSNNPEIKVGSGFDSSSGTSSRSIRPKLIIIICITIGLVGLAIYGWNYQRNKSNAEKSQNSSQRLNTTQQAQYYSDKGDYKAANQTWQRQREAATTTEGQVDALFQQSSLAVKFKKYNEALRYAEEIKDLAPNTSTPYVALAQLAEAEGDNADAKTNWRLAISKLNKNSPAYSLKLRDYQANIESLK